jgi:hypothetical protein
LIILNPLQRTDPFASKKKSAKTILYVDIFFVSQEPPVAASFIFSPFFSINWLAAGVQNYKKLAPDRVQPCTGGGL